MQESTHLNYVNDDNGDLVESGQEHQPVSQPTRIGCMGEHGEDVEKEISKNDNDVEGK